MTDTSNRTLAAFGAGLIYACVIAYTDKYVRVMAQDAVDAALQTFDVFLDAARNRGAGVEQSDSGSKEQTASA